MDSSWLALWADILLTLAIAWVPGFVVARALRLPRTWSVVTAPLASVALYSVVACALSLAHVRADVVSVVCAPAAAVLALYIVARAVARRSGARREDVELPRISPQVVGIVAAVGLIIVGAIFIRVLPYPAAVNEDWDSVFHLGHIGAIMDSGDFIAGSLGQYATPQDLAIAPMRYRGWYPSGWHLLCALVAEASGGAPLVAINAVSIACVALIYPLGWAAFAAALGYRGRTQAIFGLASLSFVIFPWGFLVHGTLYPNLFSFCLVPTMTTLVLLAVRRLREPRVFLRLLCMFLLGAVCLFFVHPGAIFTVGFLSVAGIAATISGAVPAERPHANLLRVALVAVWVAAVVAIWLGCYRLLKSTGMLGYTYPSHYLTLTQAIKNAIRLNYADGFREIAPQYVLALIVILGAARTFVDARNRWLVPSYVACCAVFALSLTTDNPLHELLGGFWYADPYRMGAQCGIFAVPLAALGIDGLCALPARVAARRGTTPAAGRHFSASAQTGASLRAASVADMPQTGATLAASCAILALICYLNFASGWVLPAPSGYVTTAFQTLDSKISYHYVEHHVLSLEELDFAQRAKEVVGDDLVINDPLDGSMFLYGTSGIRTYYRDYQLHQNENPTSATIRTALADYATDPQVRDAVQSIGAKYVLKLYPDSLDALEQVHEFDIIPLPYGEFGGIDAVDDDTPGFQVVLAEGNLRLYRIQD